ncbi:MAG: 2-C-methyl-D-erythritol 4-phosphate cytidylyltransferase [Butyricicoccaceae bacterium]
MQLRPVVPVKDSIKRIENGKIVADVPRDTLAAVQTPQVFRRELLLDALQDAAASGRSFTDDCAAVEALDRRFPRPLGSYENIKVTNARGHCCRGGVPVQEGKEMNMRDRTRP